MHQHPLWWLVLALPHGCIPSIGAFSSMLLASVMKVCHLSSPPLTSPLPPAMHFFPLANLLAVVPTSLYFNLMLLASVMKVCHPPLSSPGTLSSSPLNYLPTPSIMLLLVLAVTVCHFVSSPPSPFFLPFSFSFSLCSCLAVYYSFMWN